VLGSDDTTARSGHRHDAHDALDLVGRAAELRSIDELLAGPPQRGGVLMLRGEPGIGKTALLDAAAALAAARGFQVLRTVGAEAESGVPYAALHTLLRPIVPLAEDIPRHLRATLLAALGLAEASVPAVFAVALACLEVLDTAATQAPVCLLVDDVQWLDRESTEVLGFLSRRLQADPVVLLAAGRASGRESAGLGTGDLVVGPLEQKEARTLLAARSPEIRGQTRAELLRQAAGNPLALVELSRATPAGLPRPPTPGGALPLTDRLQAAFGDRLRDLDQQTRAALLIAALDPAATVVEVLEATGRSDGRSPSPGVLDAAVACGLVAVDERSVRFRHPIMRSAALHQASPSQLYAAHDALAHTVVDPERRLWHRARATTGRDDALGRELQAAARGAERRGAVALAVSHLEHAALRLSTAREQNASLLKAAELAAQIGQDERADRFIAALSSADVTAVEHARTRLVQLTLDDPLPGDPNLTDECIALSGQALAASDVALALALLSHAALRCWWSDPGPAARRALVAAARAVPVARSDARVIAILAEASPIEDGEDLLDRLSGVDEARLDDADAARLLGNAAFIVGEYEQSARLLDRAADRLREEGRLAPLAGVLVVRGWDAVDAGQWSLAEQAVDEALTLAADTGHTGWAAGARMLQALTAGLRGDAEQHAALVAEAGRQIRRARSTTQLRVLRIAQGTVAAVNGHHREAYELLVPLFDRTDPGFDARNTFDVIPYFADAAVQVGHHDAARQRLDELDMVLPERRPPVVRAAMDYAAATLSDDEDAEACFAAALTGAAAARPFDLARTRLAYGRWLRHRRRIVEAREPLRAARDAFDRLGNRPLGERAREELRAAGESTRQRGELAWHDLSPQEAQIARLVAEGLSNREIGQRLFVSHRTVASHLYRMFPKLGITSRVELVAAGRQD
jgi:DNA-binding CsgD family transcriptional regulator